MNIKGIKNFIKMNAPTILSWTAVVGTVATAVISYSTGEKVKLKINELEESSGEDLTKKQAITEVAPIYIPMILCAGSTIACILGSNGLNKKQQAALLASYGTVCASYKEYKDSLIKLHGKEVDEEVKAEMVRTSSEYHCVDCSDIPDTKVIFVDPISKQEIVSYERDVIDAEYHLNRNFALGGVITLNDWYEMIGMNDIDSGNDVGWCLNDDIYWLDFTHDKIVDPKDGKTKFLINYEFEPTKEAIEEYY